MRRKANEIIIKNPVALAAFKFTHVDEAAHVASRRSKQSTCILSHWLARLHMHDVNQP